jgi:hypothetical protein
MSTIYIETSIVSYLRTQPSSQLVTAARQLITKRWWQQRHRYDLLTSQYVLDEACRGDENLAAERMEALADLPLLSTPPKVPDIAHCYSHNLLYQKKPDWMRCIFQLLPIMV